MSQLPQLLMRKSDFSDLPTLSQRFFQLPAGYHLHTHIAGEEEKWEALLEKSFATPLRFAECMASAPGYDPSGVFYIRKRDGADVAVAAAVENSAFPEQGWLHYVAVDPAEQGKRLSYAAVIPCLYFFHARGYQNVLLSTDDFRLPAIKCYLNLGFVPIFSHESHSKRWEAIMEKIK